MRLDRPLLALSLLLASQAQAAITPDQAKTLETQLQTWFNTNFGKIAKPGTRAFQVTPSGDRYEIAIPTGLRREGSSDPLTVTMLASPPANGRWVFDQLKIPQPFEYSITMTPPKEPGQKDTPAPVTMRSKVTARLQDGGGVWDPTFATPSSIKQRMEGLNSQATGNGVTQTTMVESSTTEIVMTPVGTDKVNVVSTATLSGYSLKMDGGDAPMLQATAKTGQVSFNLTGASRERGTEAIAAMVDLVAAGIPGITPVKPGAANAAEPKLSPAGMAALKRIVATLPDLGSAMAIDESVTGLAITSAGKSFGAANAGLTMNMKSVSGQVQAVLGVVAEGMAWPDLGMGTMEQLLPKRLVLRPTLAGVSGQDLADVLNGAMESGQTGKPTAAETAARNKLLSRGATVGLEAMEFDTGGSTFSATGSLVLQGGPGGQPVPRTGKAHVVARDFDKLVAVISGEPMLAQAMPALVFLKGLGKSAEGGLVWDVTYDGGKLAVNGTDMSAMMGGAR